MEPSEQSTATPLLTMRNIGKRFGATQALSQVSIAVLAGEVLALIGENGAGKSTLMKVLSGAHPADEGSMEITGRPFRPVGPHEARMAGVAMIYQELNLAPDLSVEDNIMLGQECRRNGLLDRRRQRERIHEALELLGHPDLALGRRVDSLSVGEQQLVEIARGLVSEARVMIFDEPTSSLPQQDVVRLFEVIKRLRKRGLAIIYISHFLEEIRQVAQRYVVLRDGRPVGTGELENATNQEIISLMAGRAVQTLFPTVPHQIGNVKLAVENLSGSKIPQKVSFQLHRGEILGLFGLVGAGRTEILRQMFGLDATTFGTITLNGTSLHWQSLRARLRAGMGFVSEDRKSEGLAQAMSIADNLTLSDLRPYSRLGFVQLKKRRAAVHKWIEKLSIKARSPEQTISELSGGNQQKVALARVLHQQADLLLLDEPTRGIDVGTKAEIYQLIGQLAAEGKSIVLVSSYLPELMAICDTIGVMSRGLLREVRPTSEWTEHEVLAAAISS